MVAFSMISLSSSARCQKRIIRHTVKRACALIRIFITHNNGIYRTARARYISIHDYHKNLAKESRNGEYSYSSRMWEQIRQRSPPLLSLSTTDKQTTSLEMAASDREKEICSSEPKQPCQCAACTSSRSHMRKLWPDEYPTENLPKPATRVSAATPTDH